LSNIFEKLKTLLLPHKAEDTQPAKAEATQASDPPATSKKSKTGKADPKPPERPLNEKPEPTADETDKQAETPVNSKTTKKGKAGKPGPEQTQNETAVPIAAGSVEAADASEVSNKKIKKGKAPKPAPESAEQAQNEATAKEHAKKRRRPNANWVVFSCLGALALLLTTATVLIYTVWQHPLSQFESAAEQAAASTPTPSTSGAPEQSESPEATPSIKDLFEQPGSNLPNIVNIMLIGVDHAEERETWSGKHAYHSDVMIVLSIHTDTNKVYMISLPRDTYAEIPGVKGIYKLNASIDCGGGWPTESGFNKVCEAATWMLGGVPVKYYYAVDMSAVKGLVNAVGGIDYDLDLDFSIQGRSYKEGMQHMDGQAVLDYFRVRKNLESDEEGDLHRVDRQKRMLVAIFDKLKQTNLLIKLPDLIASFNGNLYTNVDLLKTGGLAAYMYKNVKTEDIAMRVMGGGYADIFGWRFVLTNQSKRVSLIKEVYGVDVPEYGKYSPGYAKAQWVEMQASGISTRAKAALASAKSTLDADAALPEYVQPDPANPVSIPGGYRRFGSGVWSLYATCVAETDALYSRAHDSHFDANIEGLSAANNQVMYDVSTLCSHLSINAPNWAVSATGGNEIKVDFR
jgi:polyisoprenyl-teichoic acid--peptidoglycan teichoic acid transferase